MRDRTGIRPRFGHGDGQGGKLRGFVVVKVGQRTGCLAHEKSIGGGQPEFQETRPVPVPVKRAEGRNRPRPTYELISQDVFPAAP